MSTPWSARVIPACSDQPQQVREGFRCQGAGCDLTAAVQNQDQAPLLFSFCKPELVCNKTNHLSQAVYCSREATSHVWCGGVATPLRKQSGGVGVSHCCCPLRLNRNQCVDDYDDGLETAVKLVTRSIDLMI